VAEAAVMFSMAGRKLFHMHFNDNYRSWDDGMIVGSVHFVGYVELLFWLRESVEFLKAIEEIRDLVRTGDAMKSRRWVRKRFLS
jgi:hypothetical protein